MNVLRISSVMERLYCILLSSIWEVCLFSEFYSLSKRLVIFHVELCVCEVCVYLCVCIHAHAEECLSDTRSIFFYSTIKMFVHDGVFCV